MSVHTNNPIPGVNKSIIRILIQLISNNCILRPLLWMQFKFSARCIAAPYCVHWIDYFNTAKRPAITAKRATPSTNAAVKIMFARMSFAASG